MGEGGSVAPGKPDRSIPSPAGAAPRRILHLGKLESIHVQRWAIALATRGWDVHVATYGNVPEGFPGARTGIAVHRLARPSLPLVSLAWRVAQLGRLIRRLRPDLVHAHSIPAYGTYAALAVPKGLPLVVTAWGFSHLDGRGVKAALDRRCIARADAVTTLVDEMRLRLASQFPEEAGRIHHIPWGVDLGMFHPGYGKQADALRRRYRIPEGAPIVLSNRNMDPYYNIETILRAAARVVEQGSNAWFLLRRGYGSDAYLRRMEALAAELGIGDRCVFDAELLPYEEVPALLNLADVSVMVPRTDQGPASLHEAMACGTFVVATDLPGNREWITPGENGFLVAASDPVALADALVAALSDEALRERATRANLDIMRDRGDWRVNVGRMEDLYAALMKDHRLGGP